MNVYTRNCSCLNYYDFWHEEGFGTAGTKVYKSRHSNTPLFLKSCLNGFLFRILSPSNILSLFYNTYGCSIFIRKYTLVEELPEEEVIFRRDGRYADCNNFYDCTRV
jgi:hypothetical protein